MFCGPKTQGSLPYPTIVLDRSSNAANLCPTSLLDVNGTLYFAANDDAHGSELWKSDGTPQGTVILQDINPGPVDGVNFVLGYQPLNIGQANGTIYFAATDGQKGYELWKTNGTPGSATLVKDINPGPGDSIPSQLRSVNGTLFFSADDGSNGCELWKSDGTAANTVLVKAINPDPQGMCPDGLVAVGNKLIFTADDGTHGSEMWLTDGTPQGTAMVQEIKPGNPPSVYVPIGYQRAGPFVFFIANDGTTGTELWAVPVAALGVRESNAYLPLLRR
jgi:ELWxxDGT repeat protein